MQPANNSVKTGKRHAEESSDEDTTIPSPSILQSHQSDAEDSDDTEETRAGKRRIVELRTMARKACGMDKNGVKTRSRKSK